MITQSEANEIFEKHPTRFKKSEKAALRSTLKAKMKSLGYADDEIREIKGGGINLAVGDPNAEYIFTAHYDTPGKSGWMLGTGWLWGQTGANIFLIVVFLLYYAAIPTLRKWLISVLSFCGNVDMIDFLISWLLLLLLIIVMLVSMAVKNGSNRNDNTSGVLSLLALAQKVSADPQLKSKCCFVFFDNEEWGLLGSSGFAEYCKRNNINIKEKKLINFDCVGYGDVLTFAATKKTPISKAVKSAFDELGQKPVFKRSKMIFLSDHANFKNSVMVSYTLRSLLGPLYLPKIHTSKDFDCNIEQINKLADDFYTFAKSGKI